MRNLAPLISASKAPPTAALLCLEMGEGTVLLAEQALANVLTLKRGLLSSFLFTLSPFMGEMVALCLVVDKSAILKQHSCS